MAKLSLSSPTLLQSVSIATNPPLLLQRNFGIIWWSQLISQIGDGVTKLALLWFVYAVTGSALQTTIIGILQTLPPIVLGPFIGVFIDRFPKKIILIGTDLIRALVIGVIPCLVSHEAFTVEFLYVLVFCNAVATSLFAPALFASIPFIVAKSALTPANALLQSTMSLGVIFGPLLSGLGIALLSSQEVLCINVLTYIGSALLLVFVSIPEVTHRAKTFQSSLTNYVKDLQEGVQFTFFQQPVILPLMLTAGLYSFVMSAFHTLLPVFGRNMLKFGPVEVGYVTSGVGVGLFLASLFLAKVNLGAQWRRIRLLATTSLMAAFAIWALTGAIGLPLSLAIVVVIGMGSGVLTPIEWGIIQEISPPQLIGRVLALYGTLAMLSAIGGMTMFGWIMEQFGEIWTLLGMGAVLLITSQVAFKLSRRVRSHSNYD
ncbi:MAG TPA: MFS transporter [Nitrospirales bacterium]|nr:MFS transporter [Nitrospirales bacterium]